MQVKAVEARALTFQQAEAAARCTSAISASWQEGMQENLDTLSAKLAEVESDAEQIRRERDSLQVRISFYPLHRMTQNYCKCGS